MPSSRRAPGSGRMPPRPKNPSAANKMTPATSPRELFGNPGRPAIEASFARGTSVTEVCASRSLRGAELGLFLMSGFHITPYLLALPRFRMIALRGTDGQGASIPTARCTCTVSRTAHEPLRLCNPIGRLPRPRALSTQIRKTAMAARRPLRGTARVPARERDGALAVGLSLDRYRGFQSPCQR